jgi:hypothetical protein
VFQALHVPDVLRQELEECFAENGEKATFFGIAATRNG